MTTSVIDAFVDSIDRFAAAFIDPLEIDRTHQIPAEVSRGLAELGAFGLSIPAAFGGSGLGLAEICPIIGALARRDRSVATTVGLHVGLGTRGLIAFGSDTLKTRVLPDLASGKKIAAFATTETGAGSDLGAIATTATPQAGALRVRGSKIYVTNGGVADVFTVTACTPGLGGARRGHSLLLLERSDGLTTGEEENKLGLRGSSTVPLYIDGVTVAEDRVIGDAGRGMAHLAHVLCWGRTVMAAGCVGAAELALERTLDQVANRVQFGKKIGSFEVVKAQVAEMAATLAAMKAIVDSTAEGENDRELLLSRSISAKIFCSEGDWAISDLALQLHGGQGFIEETGIPMLLRDARITRIFEGANDVLLVHRGTIEAATTNGPVKPSHTIGRDVCAVRDQLREEYGMRLFEKKRALHRLGRLAVLRDVSEAVVNQAEFESQEGRALADYWLSIARARIDALVKPTQSLESIEAVTAPLYARVQS